MLSKIAKSVMEPEDNRLARRIHSGICFEYFEDVSVKREYDVNNADEEDGPAANQRSQNQRLPPMPFTCVRRQTMVQQSPPHQILTPPAQQSEEQQGHTPMHGQNLMSMATIQRSHPQSMDLDHHGSTGGVLASSVKQNNILMYPNPPSTPRDTPPISNSSNLLMSASSHYKMDQYHSHIQQIHPKAPDMMESIVWSTQYLSQEHLDLRTNCKGEMGEVQDWSTLVPHHGDISNGNRAHNADHHGHQGLGPLISQNLSSLRPMNVENNNFMSPISSLGRSLNTTGSSSCDDIINNDLLTFLSIQELKKRVHNYAREEVVRLKQKLLEYIQNCRSKWMHQIHELEVTNRTLQSELHRLQMDLNRVTQERDYLKRRYELPSDDCSSSCATATVETGSDTDG